LGNLNSTGITADFEEQIIKKVEDGFMNDEFFKKLFTVMKNQNNTEFSEYIDFYEIEEFSKNKKNETEEIENIGNIENSGDFSQNALIKKILDFANKCYMHGVTVGMSLSIEIYEKDNKN
jgi:hypothetical protein